MYQIGDRVVYGIHGVCAVADIEKRVIDRKTVSYLVLEPVGQDGSRFLVPTHNQAAMGKLRPMLSPAQMKELLESDEIRADGWIREENQRKQTYRELISGGDTLALMRMVHALYLHKRNQAAAGKKVHLADDNFLRDAERLLASEIAVVMGMTAEEAKLYLRTELEK